MSPASVIGLDQCFSTRLYCGLVKYLCHPLSDQQTDCHWSADQWLINTRLDGWDSPVEITQGVAERGLVSALSPTACSVLLLDSRLLNFELLLYHPGIL